MINLDESMGPGWGQLATRGSAVRHASVARHITDCAMRPGIFSSCRIGAQRRLRRAYACAQSRQNLCCSHTQKNNVDEDTIQRLYLKAHWIGDCASLKEVFAHMR